MNLNIWHTNSVLSQSCKITVPSGRLRINFRRNQHVGVLTTPTLRATPSNIEGEGLKKQEAIGTANLCI
jgi:hypothetical protein